LDLATPGIGSEVASGRLRSAQVHSQVLTRCETAQAAAPTRQRLEIGDCAPKTQSWFDTIVCDVSMCPINLAGMTDPGLPISSEPGSLPYLTQQHFYLEQDRIEFDTENGLAIDPT
jgi:hypothetical protein